MRARRGVRIEPRGHSSCRTTISALVGRVSSLSVALSLERPRLAGLTALLTGPDGTTVRLLDGPVLAGTVFREVIGRTVESDEPLSLFAGRPATGTWTLRIEDGDDPAESRLTSWALVIEPEAPLATTSVQAARRGSCRRSPAMRAFSGPSSRPTSSSSIPTNAPPRT